MLPSKKNILFFACAVFLLGMIVSGGAYQLYRLRQTTDKITAYSEAIRSDYFALMNEYWGGSDRWSESDTYQSRAVWVNEPDQKAIVSLLTGDRRLPQTELIDRARRFVYSNSSHQDGQAADSWNTGLMLQMLLAHN